MPVDLSHRPGPGAGAIDLAGAGLAVALMCWTCAAAVVGGGDPWSRIGLVAACVGAFVAGRAAPARRERLVPALVLGGIAVIVVVGWLGWSGWFAVFGVWAYPNGAGQLFVQGAIAGAMVLAMSRTTGASLAGGVAAIACAVAALLTRSVAAGALAVVALGVAGAARNAGPRAVRTVAVGCAGVLVIAVSVPIVLGLGWRAGPDGALEGVSADALSGRRLILWHEAVTLIEREPLWGVGPGRFADVRGFARTDPDARWAHDAFLQQGAETGVAGALLTVLLFVWALAAVAAGGRVGAVPILGLMAVAALGVHACIDYVLHFAPNAVAAAALAGVASRAPGGSDLTAPGEARARGSGVER